MSWNNDVIGAKVLDMAGIVCNSFENVEEEDKIVVEFFLTDSHWSHSHPIIMATKIPQPHADLHDFQNCTAAHLNNLIWYMCAALIFSSYNNVDFDLIIKMKYKWLCLCVFFFSGPVWG